MIKELSLVEAINLYPSCSDLLINCDDRIMIGISKHDTVSLIDPIRVHLYLVKGEVIGWIWIIPHFVLPNYIDEKLNCLGALIFVKEDKRRLGVGYALANRAYLHARANEKRLLMLTTNSNGAEFLEYLKKKINFNRFVK